MEELAGFESSPQAIVAPPYAQHATKLAERKWTILGEIAQADPIALGLDRVMTPVRAGGVLAPRARPLGARDRRGRALSAADRARRHPLAAPQSAAAGAEGHRRARRLPHRQLPVRHGRARSTRSSTGRWRISAIRSRTSRGASTRSGVGRATSAPAAWRRAKRRFASGRRRADCAPIPTALRWWERLLQREGPGHLDLGRARSSPPARTRTRSWRCPPG